MPVDFIRASSGVRHSGRRPESPYWPLFRRKRERAVPTTLCSLFFSAFSLIRLHLGHQKIFHQKAPRKFVSSARQSIRSLTAYLSIICCKRKIAGPLPWILYIEIERTRQENGPGSNISGAVLLYFEYFTIYSNRINILGGRLRPNFNVFEYFAGNRGGHPITLLAHFRIVSLPFRKPGTNDVY